MVNYKCQRCGYNTTRKYVFKKHLLRKNICDSKLKVITIYDLLVLNGFDEDATKCKNILKTSSKHPQNILILSSNNEDIKTNNNCSYCSKKLSNYKNKWRHEQKCKKKKSQEELLKNLLEEKDNLIKKMLMENTKLTKQLIKLTEKSGNNNNNTINSHNKIIINAYGSENLEYISNKLLKKLVNKPGTAIPNLLKIIHFNDKYPENKNIKVTNIHDPYIKVHNGDDWKLKNKGDIIEDIIITKREILDGVVLNKDEKYIVKLERLDEVIEDKKNNYLEKSVKDILFN